MKAGALALAKHYAVDAVTGMEADEYRKLADLEDQGTLPFGSSVLAVAAQQ